MLPPVGSTLLLAVMMMRRRRMARLKSVRGDEIRDVCLLYRPYLNSSLDLYLRTSKKGSDNWDNFPTLALVSNDRVRM